MKKTEMLLVENNSGVVIPGINYAIRNIRNFLMNKLKSATYEI